MGRQCFATGTHTDFVSVGANPKPVRVTVRRCAAPVILYWRIIARRRFELEKLRSEPKLLVHVVPFEFGVGNLENSALGWNSRPRPIPLAKQQMQACLIGVHLSTPPE